MKRSPVEAGDPLTWRERMYWYVQYVQYINMMIKFLIRFRCGVRVRVKIRIGWLGLESRFT